MTTGLLHSKSLIWINWGGDIHLVVHFNIHPAPACHSNCLLSLLEIAFPWSKLLLFFITKVRKQGSVTGSGTVFTDFYFYLDQNKGLSVSSTSPPATLYNTRHYSICGFPAEHETTKQTAVSLVRADLCLVLAVGSP